MAAKRTNFKMRSQSRKLYLPPNEIPHFETNSCQFNIVYKRFIKQERPPADFAAAIPFSLIHIEIWYRSTARHRIDCKLSPNDGYD